MKRLCPGCGEELKLFNWVKQFYLCGKCGNVLHKKDGVIVTEEVVPLLWEGDNS